MATERQKRAAELIVERGGSIGRSMREAGYTEATAKTPQKLTESNGFKEVISLFDEKRRQALLYMDEKKLKASRAKDLAYIADTCTKNHQLLTGGKIADGPILIVIPAMIIEKNGIPRLSPSPERDSEG